MESLELIIKALGLLIVMLNQRERERERERDNLVIHVGGGGNSSYLPWPVVVYVHPSLPLLPNATTHTAAAKAKDDY